MIVIKTIIGLIAISIALTMLYAIGRITIRIIDPALETPDAEQCILGAMMGVLFLAMCAMIMYAMYLIGSVVMGTLGY
jgi:hypothetical protein